MALVGKVGNRSQPKIELKKLKDEGSFDLIRLNSCVEIRNVRSCSNQKVRGIKDITREADVPC